MPRPRPNDDAGQPIDPGKDLAAFLERAAPPSIEPSPEPVVPSWKTTTFDDVDDPEIKGKSGADVVTILTKRREEADAARQRSTELEIELARARQQQDQETLTRRILAEQQQRSEPPKEPEVDPRLAKRDQMWLDGDYQSWHMLNDEIQADARKRDIAAAVEQTKNDMRNEARTTSSREQGTQAYWQAQKYLESRGVPAQAFHERARAVLGEVTFESSPFFKDGGPLNPRNIVGAFVKLFGEPPQKESAPPVAPQAAAAPVQQQPTPAAPPGSGRPAPAAAAPKGSTTHLSERERKDVDQMAGAFKLDPEKLAARRRARIEKERESHA